jgi:hypothetical protein
MPLSQLPQAGSLFNGFAAPTSNTCYTPNQFFDVCLPHRSRGCVRIVSYMIRKTLGWSDEHGNPLHERVSFSYDQLIREANVGRDAIKESLAEAEQCGFIRCLRSPSAHRIGAPAVSGLYELRWDEGAEYVKDARIFSGFFAGEGNRSYIPNQFFDIVVRSQPLSVAKVVGSIARLSIGFVNKFGHRRTNVVLSLTHIQRYAKIASRMNLLSAINTAVDQNYIQVIDAGYFDPTGLRQSRAATYALKWLSDNAIQPIGRKSVPGENEITDRSEIRPGNGRKSVPSHRSEIRTDIEITTLRNKTLKQQPESVAACFSTLKEQGFDDRTATQIAERASMSVVLDQIEWLPMRRVTSNRLGLLRRAIEGNWPKPEQTAHGKNFGRPKRATHRDPIDQARQRLAERLKHKPR